MQRKLILIALCASLALPGAALAAWGAKGDMEPSTKLDATDGWMYPDRDVSKPGDPGGSKRQVYFSGFQGTNVGGALSTGVNPNIATLGTAHPTTPHQAYAMLGVWKDCNNDGFIGLGDHGLWEYRSEILAATTGASICPATTFEGTERDATPPFNDGTWVHEFIPIGYDSRPHQNALGQPIPDQNPYNIHDWGVRVWADDGVPGAPPSVICFLRPVPTGTYRTVGGIVDYVDCFSVGRVNGAATAVTNAAGLQQEWQDLKATPNPWGRESDASYVQAFDCSQPQLAHRDVTTTIGVGVSQPKVPTANAAGSPAGTVNETAAAANDCQRNDGNGEDTENSLASAPYANEDDQVINQLGPKHETDEALGFAEGTRPAPGNAQLGKWVPSDAGLGQYGVDGFWTGNRLRTTYNSFYTIGQETVSPVKHYTYYAYVSDATISKHALSLPKGSTSGVYGIEACTNGIGLGKPALNQWECDPTRWWGGAPTYANIPRDPLLCDGTRSPTGDPLDQCYQGGGGARIGRVPGDLYRLRDVDCFDESVKGAREAGVHWGILDDSACA